MPIFRKLSLSAGIAGILVALQGCSVKDIAKTLLILIALMLPGTSIGEEPDAIAQTGTNIASAFLGRATATSIAGTLVTVSVPANASAAFICQVFVTSSTFCETSSAINGWVFKGESVQSLKIVLDWTGSNIKYTHVDNARIILVTFFI